jgi:hypothetical protein
MTDRVSAKPALLDSTSASGLALGKLSLVVLFLAEALTKYAQDSIKPSLVNLPPELHLKIFNLLDRTTSTCLGLCTKKFYAIHRSMRGTVPLMAWHSYPPNKIDGKRLWELLVEWMEPGYDFDSRAFKFLAKHSRGALARKYERFIVPFQKLADAKRVDLKEAGGYVENLIWFPIWSGSEKA